MDMKTLNKVQLIGYLGEDPKVLNCANGSKLVKLNLATHHPGKNEKGDKVYVSCWHSVIAFDKPAEIAEKNFTKGSHVMVEGHLVYNTYEDKNGHTRYVTEIKAAYFTNLDR
jgi:single-strand DNA-binding protein